MELAFRAVGIGNREGEEVVILEHGMMTVNGKIVDSVKQQEKRTGTLLTRFEWRNGEYGTAWYEVH